MLKVEKKSLWWTHSIKEIKIQVNFTNRKLSSGHKMKTHSKQKLTDTPIWFKVEPKERTLMTTWSLSLATREVLKAHIQQIILFFSQRKENPSLRDGWRTKTGTKNSWFCYKLHSWLVALEFWKSLNLVLKPYFLSLLAKKLHLWNAFFGKYVWALGLLINW